MTFNRSTTFSLKSLLGDYGIMTYGIKTFSRSTTPRLESLLGDNRNDIALKDYVLTHALSYEDVFALCEKLTTDTRSIFGVGEEENDRRTALLKNLKQAMDQVIIDKNPIAMCNRALFHLISPESAPGLGRRDDYNAAIRLFQQAIELGNTSAMWCRAVMYEQGLGVGGFSDYKEAIQLYKKAIEGGNADAMNNRASMHYQGLGGPKDYLMAISLYKDAIARGNVPAMYNRAYMHEQGLDCKVNLVGAVELYPKINLLAAIKLYDQAILSGEKIVVSSAQARLGSINKYAVLDDILDLPPEDVEKQIWSALQGNRTRLGCFFNTARGPRKCDMTRGSLKKLFDRLNGINPTLAAIYLQVSKSLKTPAGSQERKDALDAINASDNTLTPEQKDDLKRLPDNNGQTLAVTELEDEVVNEAPCGFATPKRSLLNRLFTSNNSEKKIEMVEMKAFQKG
ncbi:MAG: hypothetical protein A3E85_05370 [Gammaproteobacteria bacterium RIFCSPHIGHO2_12_FULL_45_12]|nr:MAG: hypothetical protein A3E85_05370 [Gammaproteobacteria bacterium RIFCSPHIGHO2_12_FULL_45_12]